MENFISVSDPIDRSRLKADDYFQTLVTEAADKGLLSEFDIEKIQTELVELLGNICLGISEKGHGSMRSETAEKIAGSIMYTVAVMLKKSASPENAVERIKSVSIEEIFYEGRQEIVSLLTKARGKWAVITKELFETKNLYYGLVINNSAKDFFKNYKYDIAADADVVDFDYPLYVNSDSEKGVEKVYTYLSAFRTENDFLLRFSCESVHRLMMCLDDELKKTGFIVEKGAYMDLPLNIFGFVFASLLVLEYLGKDIYSLYVTKDDADIFANELSGKSYAQTVTFFETLTDRIIFELEADEEMADYLRKAVRVLATEVSVKEKSDLSGIFMYHRSEEDRFEVNETEKLSDKEYRAVLSLVNSCKSTEEKLEVVRAKIRNYEDFIDIVKDIPLNAYEILRCLPAFDMAENLRLFKRYNIFSFCFNEEDTVMQKALETYVNSQEPSTKELICKMLAIMQ